MGDYSDGILRGYYPRRRAGGDSPMQVPTGTPMAALGLVVGATAFLFVVGFLFKGKINF